MLEPLGEPPVGIGKLGIILLFLISNLLPVDIMIELLDPPTPIMQGTFAEIKPALSIFSNTYFDILISFPQYDKTHLKWLSQS